MNLINSVCLYGNCATLSQLDLSYLVFLDFLQSMCCITFRMSLKIPAYVITLCVDPYRTSTVLGIKFKVLKMIYRVPNWIGPCFSSTILCLKILLRWMCSDGTNFSLPSLEPLNMMSAFSRKHLFIIMISVQMSFPETCLLWLCSFTIRKPCIGISFCCS